MLGNEYSLNYLRRKQKATGTSGTRKRLHVMEEQTVWKS